MWARPMGTVRESSFPASIMRRQSGIISVFKRYSMTSGLSLLTKAPMTPKLVSRRYSKGRLFWVEFKKG